MRVLLVWRQACRVRLAPTHITNHEHVRGIPMARTRERAPLILRETNVAHAGPCVAYIARRSPCVCESRPVCGAGKRRVVRKAVDYVASASAQGLCHLFCFWHLVRAPVIL